MQVQRQAFDHVGQVFLIFKPDFPRRDNGFRFRRVFCFFWNGSQFMRFCIVQQPVPAVADGDGARCFGIGRRPDAHGGGHGEEHGIAAGFQLRAYVRGRAGAKERSFIHDGHARGEGEGFFQAVFGQKDRRAKFAVDLAEGGEEVRRGNGVELARRFVEDEDFRLQDHDRREVQELLLTAGQLCDGFIKPRLDAEERRHFRHAAADGQRVIAEGFEAERQLVPDLVGDDLVFGALLDKADFFSLFALGQFVEILSVKQNFSGTSAMRGEDGFELPQKCRSPAAGGAAEDQKLAGLDGQRQVRECVLLLLRICEGQISDRKDFHCLSSFRSRITGVRTSAR